MNPNHSETSLFKEILAAIFILGFIWMITTSIIQIHKCNKMSPSQVFKRIPKSFVLDFVNCKI